MIHYLFFHQGKLTFIETNDYFYDNEELKNKALTCKHVWDKWKRNGDATHRWIYYKKTHLEYLR